MKRIHCIARVFLAAGVVLGCASAAHAAGGGKLELIPDILTVLVLLAGFVALVPIVNSMIVKPVFVVLDERKEKIEGARRRAESLDDNATDILARYESAIREAREESESSRREQLDAARSEQLQITTRARGEVEREILQSRTELAASLATARADLGRTAEGLARQAAERILGRPAA